MVEHEEVRVVRKRGMGMMSALIVFLVAASILAVTMAPVLAQDEGEGRESDRPPPELEEKYTELKEALGDLRDSVKTLRSDMRRCRLETIGLRRRMRSLSADERRDLRERISEAKSEYRPQVEEKAGAVKESRSSLKENLAAAREAWEAGDIDSAFSRLDEALSEVAGLEKQLQELHGLYREISDCLQQLMEEVGSFSGTSSITT
jgi:chromosome segregation ATPase